MTHDNKNPRRNESGCLDATAYEAINRIEAEQTRYKKFIGCLYRIAELSGYYIEEIVVRDKHSGHYYG